MLPSFYDGHRAPLRLLFTCLTRIEAEGLSHMPRRGGVVVVSNHLTQLDPLVLGVLFTRQLHFMAKEELFAFKPLGWWLRKTGTFAVRRGETDRAALRRAEDLLRAGKVVMIFPEGTRSAGAQVQAARAGAAMLAARTRSPLLPVAITGTEHLRLHASGESFTRFLSRPHVHVRVGEPIQAVSGGGRSRQAAVDQVMRQIASMLPPAYRGVYAEGMPT
jgi:1-acyl-sn-glycerol-3-phosphate acyltransferase